MTSLIFWEDNNNSHLNIKCVIKKVDTNIYFKVMILNYRHQWLLSLHICLFHRFSLVFTNNGGERNNFGTLNIE